MKLIGTVTDFYKFLCHPTSNPKQEDKLSFTELNLLFAFSFLTILTVFVPIYSLLNVEDLQHNFDHLLENYNSYILFLTVVIVAPFMEEFIFRYPLKFAVTALLFTSLSFFYILYIIFDPSFNLVFLVIIWLFIACLSTVLIFEFFKIQWINFFTNNYGWIFYLHVVMFAFLHSSNFNLEPKAWIITPLLVIPQFILGMLLGYVRIRNNIWSSIYLHGLNNLIPMIPVLYALI